MELTIGIVDDQPEFREAFAKQIDALSLQFPSARIHCVALTARSELRCQANGRWPWDALFLDIDLGQMFDGLNGVNLAHLLRREGYVGAIIFMTAYDDFALEGYEVGAMRYLMKIPSMEKLTETLANLLAQKKSNLSAVSSAQEKHLIGFDEIDYIEIQKHTLHICLDSQTDLTVGESLREIRSALPGYFDQCHRSFLVNLGHMCSYSATALTLRSGRVIRISKYYRAAIQKHLSEIEKLVVKL